MYTFKKNCECYTFKKNCECTRLKKIVNVHV